MESESWSVVLIAYGLSEGSGVAIHEIEHFASGEAANDAISQMKRDLGMNSVAVRAFAVRKIVKPG